MTRRYTLHLPAHRRQASLLVGGEYTASDGYIFGKNLKLVNGKKIVQEWTTTEWPENYPPSILTLTFQAKRGGTLLTMVHSRVPAKQTRQYSAGWKEYYWAPLKAYFSRLKKESVGRRALFPAI